MPKMNKEKIKANKTEYIKIPKPSKEIISIIVFPICLLLLGLTFVKFFIPFTLSMIGMFTAIIKIYIANIDNINIKFFGGLIFLFISYKIFEVLINIWLKLGDLFSEGLIDAVESIKVKKIKK